MAKKKDERQEPGYEKVKTIEDCDKKIAEAQRTISKKYKLRVQAEESKRDTVSSFNEQIKHLKEELEHELGVLSAWEDRRRVIAAGGVDASSDDADAQSPAPAPAALPPPPPPAAPVPPPVASAQPPSAPSASIPMPSLPTAFAPPPPPPAPEPATGAKAANGAKMVPFPTKRAAS